jgi:hypothetical protein
MRCTRHDLANLISGTGTMRSLRARMLTTREKDKGDPSRNGVGSKLSRISTDWMWRQKIRMSLAGKNMLKLSDKNLLA